MVSEDDNPITFEDDHGEFYLDRGTGSKPLDDDYSYDVCGATLNYTFERYGQKRYCEGMARSNFHDFEDDKWSSYCKHHRSRESLDKLQMRSFKSGAYTQSYKTLAKVLPPHKYLVAVELYENLRQQSVHDFGETSYAEQVLLTEDADWLEDDKIKVQFPVGEHKRPNEKALWFAALDFCRIESMEEQIFEDAFTSDRGVGEREVTVTVTEDGREITDEEEHHLNLPLSRITKDYKRHLEFGGVPIEAGDDEGSGGERDWHMNVGPDSTINMMDGTSEEDYEQEETDVPEFDSPE